MYERIAVALSLSAGLAGGASRASCTLGSVRMLGLPEMLSAINRAGLASAYADTLVDYENTGILDRGTLRAIGDSSGVRYLAKLNLGNFKQSSDKRLAIAGVCMFDTWRAKG